MRLIVLNGLVLAGLVGSALAETTCQGHDLMARLKADDPAAFARVEAHIETIPNSTGNFWRIDGASVSPSYLFGTAHVTDDRATGFLGRVADQLDDARILLVELAPDQQDPQAISRAVMDHALLPGGATLDDALAPADRELLAAATARHGLPWSVARLQGAGFLATMLAMPPCAKLALLAGAEVLDARIVAAARARDIPVVGLETAEEQFRAIASLDNDVQLKALIEVLRLGVAFSDDVYETTVALYAAERTAAIQPLLEELALLPTAAAANRDATAALVAPRNRLMFERAWPEVETGGAFIAVGALHLSGETGLVAQFRRAGFALTRVK